MKEINIRMPNRSNSNSQSSFHSGKGIKMDGNSLCGIQSGFESNNIFSAPNSQMINNVTDAAVVPLPSFKGAFHEEWMPFLKCMQLKYAQARWGSQTLSWEWSQSKSTKVTYRFWKVVIWTTDAEQTVSY